MKLIETLKRIERLDRLIRLKATGSPEKLAHKLDICKKTLYNTINFMKEQGAKIYFCPYKQSFCYEEEVYFGFGFFVEEVQRKKVRGGSHSLLPHIVRECNKLTLTANSFVRSNVGRATPRTLLGYKRLKRDGVTF